MGQKDNEELYSWAVRTGHYSYEQLVDFADDNLSDQETIARFFYYWIALHIDYDDSITMGDINNTRQGAQSVQVNTVFASKKTTCLGFTNLYHSFLRHFNISHRLVVGYTRSPINVLEGIEPQEDHAWSAVMLNDQWHLVEITWANQYIDDPYARDYYFKTDPAEMMLQHFPKKEEWQLLEEPWSFEKFVKSPLLDPWYLSRSTPGQELIQTGKNAKGEIVITCLRPTKWKLSLKAVNQHDQDLGNLKYKVNRNGNTLQFTLKKYDGKSHLRLDAIRIGVNSSEIEAPGLAYFIDITKSLKH
ncbi:MAG: hypothetical protein Roseis2KO_59060 [Roseivirga sp.]